MWNKDVERGPDRDQLSMLIGIILFGLAITEFIQLPSREIGATVFGSDLGISLSSYWMIVGVLVILASTGTDMIIRSHPHLPAGRMLLPIWILPGLAILVAGWALLSISNWLLWWSGLIITGALVGGIVTAEYALVDESEPASSRPRLFLNIMAYGLLLALYAMIYQTRSRSLIVVTATLAVSFLVAVDLLWGLRSHLATSQGIPTRRILLLAGALALIMAECSWAINYWQAGLATASLLLLLIFYITSGLAMQAILAKLTRSLLIEYGLVAALGTGLLIAFHP